MSFIGQYLNSFGRVQTFISQPDIVPTEPTNDGEVRVVIDKGEFTWPGAQQPAVKNVNLNVSDDRWPSYY
jgi:ABC-type transport system involved in cytochrome bd biosynthesis fused ATPase/permease subunit